jgi:hypothetical protein
MTSCILSLSFLGAIANRSPEIQYALRYLSRIRQQRQHHDHSLHHTHEQIRQLHDLSSALGLISPLILLSLVFTEQYALTDPALTALAGLIPLHVIYFVDITITRLPNFYIHWRAVGIMGHAMVTENLLMTQNEYKITLHEKIEGHDILLRVSTAYSAFYELTLI